MDHRTTPPLEPGTCHVWWGDSEGAWPDLCERLEPAEQERVAPLRREEDRRRRAIASLVLADRSASYLGSQVTISRTCSRCGAPHGKPIVTGPPGSRLEVSVAHSGRWVAVAFSREAPVGVDVEVDRPQLEADRLADRALAAEERTGLSRLAPDGRRWGFLRYWTRKEAVVKAVGTGLAVPLDSVVVSAPDAAPRLLAWPAQPPASQVSLFDLDPGLRHAAALAVLGPCDAVLEFTARG